MRKRRILVEGARYHVIARVNRGEFIFESSVIKEVFLETFKKAKKRFKFSVISFCIMDNHVHLIICPQGNSNLSRIMQWVLSNFAVRFNRMFSLHGHVWYDRFKSKVIQGMRQFLATFLYIAENPVRAGVVCSPLEYRYGGPAFFKEGRFDLLDPPCPELRLLCPAYTEF